MNRSTWVCSLQCILEDTMWECVFEFHILTKIERDVSVIFSQDLKQPLDTVKRTKILKVWKRIVLKLWQLRKLLEIAVLRAKQLLQTTRCICRGMSSLHGYFVSLRNFFSFQKLVILGSLLIRPNSRIWKALLVFLVRLLVGQEGTRFKAEPIPSW